MQPKEFLVLPDADEQRERICRRIQESFKTIHGTSANRGQYFSHDILGTRYHEFSPCTYRLDLNCGAMHIFMYVAYPEVTFSAWTGVRPSGESDYGWEGSRMEIALHWNLKRPIVACTTDCLMDPDTAISSERVQTIGQSLKKLLLFIYGEKSHAIWEHWGAPVIKSLEDWVQARPIIDREIQDFSQKYKEGYENIENTVHREIPDTVNSP